MPIYDAEWSLGAWPDGWGMRQTLSVDKIIWEQNYFQRLLRSPKFRNEVKSEWEKYKTKIPEIKQKISELRDYIQYAQEANFAIWPDNPQDINAKLEGGADFVEEFFDLRMDWLDYYFNYVLQ